MKIHHVRAQRSIKNIAIIGGGRSLQGFDFNQLRDENCFVIAVNGSGDIVPFADAWFTLDPWGLQGRQLPRNDKWEGGQLYAAIPEYYGTKYADGRNHRDPPTADIRYLQRVPYETGLCEDPWAIHTGNSGFGAMGLAYHMRPEKILLLGIDGDFGYHYTTRKQNRNLSHLPRIFRDSLPQLKKRGIRVINGSPTSTVDCFTRYTPDYGLELLLS
jgi:hypothetical protein